MDEFHEVIVIGGGITGLTVAHHLNRGGTDVVVLEKEGHTGGTMTTLQKDGWLVERGPNSALETTPLLNELFTELGILDKVVYANECSDKRYVVRNAELHPIPMSPGLFLRSKLWSTRGKLRILKEPFIGKSVKDETIAEFVTRRLGKELLDYAINPFVAGVYAGDPSKLSVRCAFPKLYALEEKYGGLIRGMILGAKERKNRAEKAKDRSRQFSFRNGMQTLPDTLTQTLGNRVKYGTEIIGIKKSPGPGPCQYEVKTRSEGIVKTYGCKVLVLAIPSFAAASLIREFDQTLSGELNGIYYPPVTEIFLGYREEDIGRKLDGFGFLVPEKEGRKILGTIWSSTIFPGRSPEGFEGFTTFVGGSRQPGLASLADAEILDTVHRELIQLMNIKGLPAMSFINRWPKAIPQYQLGHDKIINHIESFESQNKGIILGGNFRGGISVSDCVISAHRIFEQAKKLLS
jgi:oxygen-dependent protoporphyrinogen oxidase